MVNRVKGWLSYYTFRVKEEYYRKKNIIRIYFTNVGLKNYNMGKVAQLHEPFIINNIELPADELYLGPDFLKDFYTLLNCPLIESPHYFFMKALKSGRKLEDTEYVNRWTSGTLDWRNKMPIGKQIKRWEKMFEVRKKEIESESVPEILVYKINERYYIYDGKHRAALGALMKEKIRCKVISESCIFSYYSRYMLDTVVAKKDYSKHTEFFKSYLKRRC